MHNSVTSRRYSLLTPQLKTSMDSDKASSLNVNQAAKRFDSMKLSPDFRMPNLKRRASNVISEMSFNGSANGVQRRSSIISNFIGATPSDDMDTTSRFFKQFSKPTQITCFEKQKEGMLLMHEITIIQEPQVFESTAEDTLSFGNHTRRQSFIGINVDVLSNQAWRRESATFNPTSKTSTFKKDKNNFESSYDPDEYSEGDQDYNYTDGCDTTSLRNSEQDADHIFKDKSEINQDQVANDHRPSNQSMQDLIKSIQDSINGTRVYHTPSGSFMKVQDSKRPTHEITVSDFAAKSEEPCVSLNQLSQMIVSMDQVKLEAEPTISKDAKMEEEKDEQPKGRKTKRAAKSKAKAVSKTTNKRSRKLTRKNTASTGSSDQEEEKATKGKTNKCKDCGRMFTAQGLGGHRAKAHKDNNPEYQAKIQRRRENSKNLLLLRLAQFYYYEQYSQNDIAPEDIPRPKISKLKQRILEDPELMASLQTKNYKEVLKTKKEMYGKAKRQPNNNMD